LTDTVEGMIRVWLGDPEVQSVVIVGIEIRKAARRQSWARADEPARHAYDDPDRETKPIAIDDLPRGIRPARAQVDRFQDVRTSS
jgi:hypothetical protein